MKIGTNIKTIRTSKSIKQKDLATELGITPHYLSMIENNSKRPSLSLLEKLAQTLDVPLKIIFSELPLAI